MNSLEKVKSFMIKKNNVEIIKSLYDRWQHEKEYEDWADYEIAMKNLWGSDIVKGTKRPFGFYVNVNGTKYHIKLKLTRTTMGMCASYY